MSEFNTVKKSPLLSFWNNKNILCPELVKTTWLDYYITTIIFPIVQTGHM